MDIVSILVTMIPVLLFLFLFYVVVILRLIKKKIFFVIAVKNDDLNNVEIRSSTNKNKIDEWEKLFWDKGYLVTRKDDYVRIGIFKWSV